jgi:hypothetical protein
MLLNLIGCPQECDFTALKKAVSNEPFLSLVLSVEGILCQMVLSIPVILSLERTCYSANLPIMKQSPVVSAGNQHTEYFYCAVLIAGLHLFLILRFYYCLKLVYSAHL